MSECYDAAKVGGKLLRNDVVLRDDAKTRLGTFLYGVDFMPALRAMKIEFSVFIAVVERYGLGVIIIAEQSKHTRFSVFEYLFAGFFGKSLPFSSHFSEHNCLLKCV